MQLLYQHQHISFKYLLLQFFLPEKLSTLIASPHYSKTPSEKVPDGSEDACASNNVFPFIRYFCYQHFYNCNIIILYLCFSIKFCLSNSSHIDTNSFLTPEFPAALLDFSISNLSTSAIRSHGKMMVGSDGVIPFPVYRSFSSQIGFNMLPFPAFVSFRFSFTFVIVSP